MSGRKVPTLSPRGQTWETHSFRILIFYHIFLHFLFFAAERPADRFVALQPKVWARRATLTRFQYETSGPSPPLNPDICRLSVCPPSVLRAKEHEQMEKTKEKETSKKTEIRKDERSRKNKRLFWEKTRKYRKREHIRKIRSCVSRKDEEVRK